ncbi:MULTISPECIES: TonB-dependent siderophore receptor [Vibrio]|uniref:TonB-dependent siderophore receptor n=1 Tax=Vibrio TaxID=662 RepID=UPI000C170BE2|nr:MULTISPECIES: TonB-dependent siderophore receptor [Vibrio]NNN44889.1 TonB-dependent siderophore receptor [Vibrio sp. 1-1(7)]NNN72262.1 TonB-dependent siderophore receptor [Vibrio sp. 12-2(3-a)]
MDICNKSALWLAITAAISTHALAQQETAPDQNNIVVWGTKVSSSSESLTTDDLSLKQADHMSDLLRDIPGVDVGGTHSVNQRINIRGLGETDLDIRLDGASQHANMFHHVGNLTLNPDILKSANVQVGNNSVTQSGLGGAVYFETKNAKDLLVGSETFGTRVFGGYSSNNSRQGSVTVYGQLNQTIDALIYVQGISRGDFKEGDGQKTFGVEGDTYNVLAKIGFEPSDGHRFQLAYDAYRDEGDYRPRADMAGSANEGLSQNRLIPTHYDRDTITGSYELKTAQHQGKVTLYSSQTKIDRDESVMAGAWPSNRVSRNTATNRNVGINALFQSDYQLANLRNQITYGMDYIDQTSKASYGNTSFMKESTISTAAFAENKLYATEAWSLTGGLRFDDFQRKAVTGKKDFDRLTWSLGTEWDVNSNWTLFANARSLFKGPELLETFVRYQDITYLADNIKAETGLNTQGGVRFDKQFGEHFIGTNLTLFKTKINDHIRTDNNYLISNVGDVEVKGFELSTTYTYQALSTKLAYARSDTKDLTNGGPLLNADDTSADMGDSIALTLSYQADSIDTLFGWNSIIVLDEDNVVQGSAKKEGYDVHNLYAQWTPYTVPNLVLTFGIDNVFDETYTSHASRLGAARGFTLDDKEPGRSYKLSAAYQF